ncbi:hypothetical protein FQN60_002831 [Etheostoma spectabile]|uniref:Uncharacterized protein n=1 Tax=Etheostoma spectabile TaxID=54343 RepID=A0A5J5CLR3_9PERO|nr:hypothetical protein FQN60_002831 [Etheostoma spectabile]
MTSDCWGNNIGPNSEFEEFQHGTTSWKRAGAVQQPIPGLLIATAEHLLPSCCCLVLCFCFLLSSVAL